MSFYIIIRGPLGIGKSTIAKKLADKLDGEYISIDKILEENGLDKADKKLGCISPKNFLKANKIILPSVKELLKREKVVVFDGNFYHKEQIVNLAENLKNYKIYAFTLKAPLEVCIARDKGRQRVYGEGAATAVHNLVSKFDYGKIIQTEDKTADEVVKLILGKIKD